MISANTLPIGELPMPGLSASKSRNVARPRNAATLSLRHDKRWGSVKPGHTTSEDEDEDEDEDETSATEQAKTTLKQCSPPPSTPLTCRTRATAIRAGSWNVERERPFDGKGPQDQCPTRAHHRTAQHARPFCAGRPDGGHHGIPPAGPRHSGRYPRTAAGLIRPAMCQGPRRPLTKASRLAP